VYHKVSLLLKVMKEVGVILVSSLALSTIVHSQARDVDKFIKELKDKDSSVRYSAAYALGKIGNSRAVEPLISCLKDESSSVRSSAADALGKIGDSRAVKPLVACLKDQDPSVRYFAEDALGKIGMPAVEPLIACLKEIVWWVRSSAADALGKIGDNRAVEPLISCLKDESSKVRRSAAYALGQIGDKMAASHLISALPDWDANHEICTGLEKMGWLPKTVEEQIYFWIGMRDKKNLISRWELTVVILIRDIRSHNRRKIENATYTFISLGKEEISDELVRILDTKGNEEMAKTYLNCGNSRLGEAARSWARSNGYSVTTGFGSGKAAWGRW